MPLRGLDDGPTGPLVELRTASILQSECRDLDRIGLRYR
jgi:hypothetical protein